MTEKEKIRAEIERRIEDIKAGDFYDQLDSHRKEIVDILNEHLSFIDSMQEEPDLNWKDMSLQEKKDLVAKLSEDIRKEEPASEDMWEASKQYALRQVLASTDAKMSEQAYLDLRLFSGFELAVAHKDGANWQKQQIMKDAVNGTIEFVERDGMCKPTILYEPSPNNKMQLGEKVKVIIIKQ